MDRAGVEGTNNLSTTGSTLFLVQRDQILIMGSLDSLSSVTFVCLLG